MKKETIDSFFSRSFVNFNKGLVLVWKTKLDKEKENKETIRRLKPERWDFETARRYLDFLEEQL